MSFGARSAVHGPRSLRSRTALAAGLLLTLLTVLLALPDSAGAAGSGPMTHPELDWMGSTIRAHEGGSTTGHVATPLVTQTPGMDVSGYQGNVNWSAAWSNGGRFAYVKATEGTSYTSPYFAQQYNGSYNIGMIRGSYHFALPDNSGGAAQADYFVNHGGGWSRDGKTLPGALDIEYNPYGATCYGLSAGSMVNWIAAFSNEYRARTGRYPTIYSSTNWWTQCTGNSSAFSANNPLWIPRYSTSVGALPAGWGFHTIWQYADSGVFPGDQDRFNGAYDRLQAFANG
ncbi:lysozyme [Streptomyces sp. SPB162]|uniref:lysozyme n=1 Tax=Streptomyces sp. SPB162 TaxID=2940560 RepID=UPI0024073D7F|nr:lysozyme [Streptomyces sp. SPB162]MDF9815594.1 GH25 family lysozyme M1 (1,4-beta-N-acetylmuramidase) [Streptomyces sp. SPB162]